jgi:hypothetical protein
MRYRLKPIEARAEAEKGRMGLKIINKKGEK